MLHVAFRDHLAAGVRNLLAVALAHIFAALDFLRPDFGHPALVAALDRRALHLHGVALAGAVDATAAARIPRAAAGLLHALAHDRTGTLGDVRLPVATADLNAFRVVHRLADRVAARAVVRLVARFADRVRNVVMLHLVDRLADCITAFPYVLLVARLADRVAHVVGLGLVARFADRVAHVVGLGLVARFADVYGISQCLVS